jgi:hypothetical protein
MGKIIKILQKNTIIPQEIGGEDKQRTTILKKRIEELSREEMKKVVEFITF